MPNCSVLLDSNSYFRLAQSIRPLLKREFGKKKRYCLGVIDELQEEYERNPRLRSKFYWVEDAEYIENRKECFSPDVEQKANINNAFFFIREFAKDEKLGVSDVDIRVLSYAYNLRIPIVTDDQDIHKVAKEYDIKVYPTLKLLKLMLDNNFITKEKVREIAKYWIYSFDTPNDFKKDYKKLFNEESPK